MIISKKRLDGPYLPYSLRKLSNIDAGPPESGGYLREIIVSGR
jgi:hypothetical protein